ncbi:MAG: hypothetical protein D3914_11105 [Candidatus Electrothrix sp. LOE2]|nr:hypothetical protein [Candidatus Electrothrix sp. LOE2]
MLSPGPAGTVDEPDEPVNRPRSSVPKKAVYFYFFGSSSRDKRKEKQGPMIGAFVLFPMYF